MNKKFFLGALSVLAFTASLFLTNLASAESFLTQYLKNSPEGGGATLLVEDFNYPAGSLLTANGWTAHSGSGTNPVTVTAPGLTFPGYPSSGVGNAVSLTTSGEDVHRTFAAQSSGSVYAAFMVNVSEAAVDAVGGYFFHLGPDPLGTTFRGRVYIKKDASNNIAFGISKAGSAAADISFTPFSYSLNTTYLIVVKYTIVEGTANDTVSLFVLTTTPATEPAATVTAPDTSASDINPGAVALRQGSSTTSPTVRVDGIRIGTSWASVTQAGGGTPRDANVDFNGDGRSDWVVTRNADPMNASQMTWFTSYNGVNNLIVTPFGLSTDVRVPEDYDGDGKDDFAVWRGNSDGSNRGYFFILQSMTNTVRIEKFGLAGDDPRVVADYDGDNKADLAVYRKNASGPNFFYFRSSLANNNFSGVALGRGADVRPNVGDYNGDGRADFAVQIDAGGGSGQFVVSINGTNTIEYVNWGRTSDTLVPGDFDGDNRSDFAVVRNENGVLVWYILERDGGGTGAGGISWGRSTDKLAPGDYDGDGRQDIAVWRPNADATMNFFLVRKSSDGNLLSYEWGQQNDEPAANWFVH